MNGKSLLLGLSYIDGKFIEESEKDMPLRHAPALRPLLVAAIIIALLLAGCGYVALSEPEWLQSFFSRQKGQPLSQGQAAYIEQNTQIIGQSVSRRGYTVSVESALAEKRVACIRLRLEGEGITDIYSARFEPRELEKGKGYEALFYEKGQSPAEESPYGSGMWALSPDGENVISVIIQLDQSAKPDAPSFKAGVPYILHLTDLCVKGLDGAEKTRIEETWDFEIVFDNINTDCVELLSAPITISSANQTLRITSFKLRTMGIDLSIDAENFNYNWRDCFLDSQVVLKDGSAVPIYPLFGNSGGSLGLKLDCPIVLAEVDYVKLDDGTRLYLP